MKKYILVFLACFLGMEHAWSSNGLIVNDVTLPLSGEATIDIGCSFSSTYLGYQLDVVLADGLELVENNGKVVCENGFTGTDHSIKSQKKENNIYRFVVVSMDENQLPSSGSLLKMYVRVKEGVSLQGQVNAKVTSVKFTTVDFDEDALADVNFHINIASKTSQNISLSTLPTMTYGDANYSLPQTTVEGLSLTWTSSNTAVATISNNTLTIKGAGTATITASQAGSDNYLPFSREYQLTIDKAVLTITANDCSKKQGETNPPLTVSYKGFKYNDNASSLTTQPTVTTTATKDSPVGTYPITVSGAVSKNYKFTYVSGTLTVTEKPTEIVVTDISAIDNAIYIDPFTTRVGGDVNIEICLKNAETATAYVFDLVLPEGVTVAKNDKGKFIDALSGRHDDHTRTFNDKGNNTYSLSTLSGNSEPLSGNDGAIRLVTLHVADGMAEGVYAVEIKNASYSKPDGTLVSLPNTTTSVTVEDYVQGDVNGNNGVDIGDAVSIVNYLVGKESTTFVEKAADTNKNGQIDIGDAVTIVNYLVGKTESLSRSAMTIKDEKEPQ